MESGALKIDDINEGIVSSVKVGDGLYVVCIGVNAPALLYNKTLLDEAGIEVKDQMTIDEFVALSKVIYEKTAYKTNLGYGTDMVLGYIMRGYGVYLLEDGKLNITAEDAEKIFTLYAQGISEGWMLGSEVFAETSVGTVVQDPMIYGSAPEYMSWCALFWSNQVTAMQATAPEGVEIGIIHLAVSRSREEQLSEAFPVLLRRGQDAASPYRRGLVDFWTNSIPANEQA